MILKNETFGFIRAFMKYIPTPGLLVLCSFLIFVAPILSASANSGIPSSSVVEPAYRLAQASSDQNEVVQKARRALSLGNNQRALELYQQAAKEQPKNSTVLGNLADLYLQNENYRKAKDTYENLIDLSPEDPQIRLQYAKSLYELGYYQRVRSELNNLSRLNPSESVNQDAQTLRDRLPYFAFVSWDLGVALGNSSLADDVSSNLSASQSTVQTGSQLQGLETSVMYKDLGVVLGSVSEVGTVQGCCIPGTNDSFTDELDVSGTYFGAKGRYFITENLSLKAQSGLWSWSFNADRVREDGSKRFSFSESGSEVFYGAGINYDWGRFGVALDYSSYPISLSSGLNYPSNVIGVKLSYRIY